MLMRKVSDLAPGVVVILDHEHKYRWQVENVKIYREEMTQQERVKVTVNNGRTSFFIDFRCNDYIEIG